VKYVEDSEGRRVETEARDLEGEEIVVWDAAGFGATDVYIAAGHMTWERLDTLKAAIAEAERRWRKIEAPSTRTTVK
jgi:hypothetical protein